MLSEELKEEQRTRAKAIESVFEQFNPSGAENRRSGAYLTLLLHNPDSRYEIKHRPVTRIGLRILAADRLQWRGWTVHQTADTSVKCSSSTTSGFSTGAAAGFSAFFFLFTPQM
jgi:hypothetical protein